jgi:23S rRNA pseudouridine1911/1915/1917 synthase
LAVQHDHLPLLSVVAAVAALDPDAARGLIERGGAWIDGQRVQDPDRRVAAGGLLSLHFPPPDERPAVITAADILYEDAALLVLNKPAGVYVTMTPWSAVGDVQWAARCFIAERDGSAPPLHLAHQLDRDTSGVLVMTKDPRANAPLQAAFLNHLVHKRYLALATGVPAAERWVARTGHGRGAHGLFRVYPLEAVGSRIGEGKVTVKSMETHFEVVERFSTCVLVAARPITGRTHQIRLHLREAGYPVVGDVRYGGAIEVADLAPTHHLLHAAELELPHPTEERRLRLIASLPPLFSEVIARLRDME